MRFILSLFFSVLLAASIARPDGVPVAPLPPETLESGEQIFRVRNARIEILVAPASDGMVSLRHLDGENVLSGPVTVLPFPLEIMESALPVVEGEDVPRWQARGWVTSENWQVVMLTQTFGPPVNMRVNQVITLPADRGEVHWHTRMTSLSPSDLAATPALTWPTPFQDNTHWRRAREDEETVCDHWAEQAPPAAPFSAKTLASLGPGGLFQKWQSTWTVEDGAELTPRLRFKNRDATHDQDPKYVWKAELPDLMPPQGWTLVHDLKWSVRHAVEIDEICNFLTP